MNICIIPARGGSKRIPRKNIREFNGKPIIAYSIEVALGCDFIDKVIVSTDDKEISEVAIKYGASVPFVRPRELSDDFTATNPVVMHAVDWMESNGYEIESVCCLYATAPLLSSNLLTSSYKKFIKNKADFCFSVTSFPFPIQRAVKVVNDRVVLFYPEYYYSRSQDLEDAFHDAGQFYWGNKQSFMVSNPLLLDNVVSYVLPRYLVQDIDTLEDWKMAELMYQVLQQMDK
mgnify:CR=1 FL=1